MKKITMAVSLLLAVCLLPQVAMGQKVRRLLPRPILRPIKVPRGHILTTEEIAARRAAAAEEKALFNRFRQVIAENDYEALAALLEQGADPNLREKSSGMTPLMVATVTGARFSMVELLLDKGANKDAKDNLGKTAADYAQMRAQATVALLNGEESLVLSEVRVIVDKETGAPVCTTINVDQAYQILGVFPEDHAREIEVAYRSALMKLHPDKQADKSAEEQAAARQQFKRVQEAYHVITQSRTATNK